tara:strand:- start:1163 stop:2296 length:1134 start_codon:yes stop_codon:yes gene_type:complete
MAQRGRPRKKPVESKAKSTSKAKIKSKPKKAPKIEPVEVEEQIVDNTVSEPKAETVSEPEIKDDSIDISDVDYSAPEPKTMSYNPFAESVEEKEYRTPKVETSPMIEDINEPVFERPSFQDLVSENQVQVEEEGLGGTENSFAQEEIQELPQKQQEEAAKGLVEQALNLYTLGCKGLGHLSKIKESKVDDLAKEGLIDLSIQVPIDPYTNVSIPEIVQGFNSEVVDAFDVSEDFKDEVRPIMNRVFIKRGWGMTDEQQLMFAFGMDFVQKGAILMQLKKQGDVQLQKFMDMTDYKNSRSNVKFSAPENAPEPTRGRRPRPQPQPVVSEAAIEEEPMQVQPEEDILEPVQEDSSMVNVVNPDIKINKHDLDQIDVDNV